MSSRTIRIAGGFTAALLLIYAVALVLVQQAITRADHPEALAFALSLDLGVLVPFLYYLFMVRGLGWPRLSVVPVFLVSLMIGALIVPREHQQLFEIMRYAGGPLEVGFVLYIVYGVRTAVRRSRAGETLDEVEAIESVALELVGRRRIARILSSEVNVLYFAIVSWITGLRAVTDPSFTLHRRCGYDAVFGVVCFAMLVEVFSLHLVVSLWSATAAWVLTGLGFYGLLWFIADYRALTHHPVRLTGRGLLIRFGLRWRLEIPYREISRVEAFRGGNDSDLKLAPWGGPNVRITLDRPHVAEGLYGLERRVRSFVLSVDEKDAFLEALGSARTGEIR